MKTRKRVDKTYTAAAPETRGVGPESAGQSGDTQGLSGVEQSGPESVEQLVEEGQWYEAAVIEGVENAPDADIDEVHTHETPEDDVPPEYLERGETGEN